MKTYDMAADDPYGVEASQIAKRRQLAEMLASQGMGGIPAYSNKAGIARMLTSILGQQQMRSADQEERELSARKEAARREDTDRLFEFATQRPDVGPDLPQVDDEGNQMPGNMQATAAKRLELVRAMMGSRNPQIAQFAQAQLLAKPAEPKTYTLSKGQVVKDATGRVIADNPEAEKPDGPKRGSVRTVTKGLEEVQQEWDGSQWVQIGQGPRFNPKAGTTVNVNGPKEDFRNEKTLRDEFMKASEPFVKVRDAFSQVKDALSGDITAPATLAGATKFMKMLDPDSVVRESELNMALKSSGMLDRFLNLHNTVLKGGVLTPSQAQEIQRIAGVLYQTAEGRQKQTNDYYTGLAAEYGLNAGRIVRDLSAGGGAPPVQSKDGTARIQSDADYNALPSGAVFVGPDGKTRRKP